MKTPQTFKGKLIKGLLLFIASILVFAVLVVLFVSPITKYLIEKYDEQYTGRKITMNLAYVNPFTGYIYFSKLKIYEFESEEIFFESKGLSLNVAMFKLLSDIYEVSEFTLNEPRGFIIQNRTEFNFNDLIEKFSSKEKSDIPKEPLHFNLLNVKIKNGEFHYEEEVTPINYFIKNVNFESSGTRWDEDTVLVKFSFLSGIRSGEMDGDFTINLKNLDYRLAVVVQKFDLNIIEQYLNDLSNYGNFAANLDADIKAKGRLNDAESITTHGIVTINNLHIGKSPKEDYASFDKLIVAIREVSPRSHTYLFDSISLNRPYFKYERYDSLDNLQTMFGKNGDNIKSVKADSTNFNLVIEIADYLKVLSKNFFKSDYKINRLAIYQGDIRFNDYSLSEKFSAELNPFYVIADSIDKNHDRVNVSLKTGIKPYGNLSAALSINPKDSSDFDMHYNLQKIPLSMFNPYLITYTSFPLDRGTIELNGLWNVRNGMIQSKNHVLVIDARVAKRVKNKSTNWIPMPLIMAFVRERGNVIDYEIPITGNLNNPKFNLRDVIFDIVENIFVKPVTTPYRMEVKNVETEIEKLLSVKWKTRSTTLSANQDKFIEKMADFLLENPDATLAIYPHLYTIKEKEYILFFEAKKKYFLKMNNKDTQSFSEADSMKVAKMSIKDSLFVQYLNMQTKDTILFTSQEKCVKLLGAATIQSKFEQLNEDREKKFVLYFKNLGVDKRIKFYANENVIPYDGFSFYKIIYKKEFPESLLEAYHQMNDLNDEAPRNEFKKKRQKIN